PEVARDRLRCRRLQKRAPSRAIRSRPATSITRATPTSCSLLLGEVHEVTAFRDAIVSGGILFHYADDSASGGTGATHGDAGFCPIALILRPVDATSTRETICGANSDDIGCKNWVTWPSRALTSGSGQVTNC